MVKMTFAIQHKFSSDLLGFQDRKVLVLTTSGKSFEGIMKSVDPDRMHVFLQDAKDEGGQSYPALFIPGTTVQQIVVEEKAINLQALAEILEKTFPRMVKVDESGGLIVVADRVRVTAAGVTGVGPTADKVKKIYEDFVKAQT